jgi:hypothetical protein
MFETRRKQVFEVIRGWTEASFRQPVCQSRPRGGEEIASDVGRALTAVQGPQGPPYAIPFGAGRAFTARLADRKGPRRGDPWFGLAGDQRSVLGVRISPIR